ncbi:MAG: GxxExxY protein [Flavobacteriaceae bacterium]|nr:GxxExxY protein [Flavobacteriaceae bacterium]
MRELTKKYINELTYKIVGACIEVHKILGPGLYEDAYHQCLKREFDLLGMNYLSEFHIDINYKGMMVDCKAKCDFLIENLIVLELKSVNEIHPIHEAQTLNYMNLMKKPKSILVNFNVTNIYHEGTKTFVSKIFEELPDR